jgi:hypothetical protein
VALNGSSVSRGSTSFAGPGGFRDAALDIQGLMKSAVLRVRQEPPHHGLFDLASPGENGTAVLFGDR